MLFPLKFTIYFLFLFFPPLAAIKKVILHYVIILPLVENFSFWFLLYTLLYLLLLPYYAKQHIWKIAQFFDENADRNLTGKMCIGSQYF